MTSSLTSDLTSFESQFAEAKPCEAPLSEDESIRCDKPAEWAVWTLHGRHTCPQTRNMCTEHKDAWIQNWAHLLKHHPNIYCEMCGEQAGKVHGPLENVIRVMEL